MKNWYIRNNEEQLGPYSNDDLKMVGLYNDDYVWKEGLPHWTKASSLTELKDFLIIVENSLFASDENSTGRPQPHPAIKKEESKFKLRAFLNSIYKKLFASKHKAL